MILDLHKGTLLNNNYTTPGVTNVNIAPNANPRYREMKCSHMADMKVTFQGLPRCWNNWNQCVDRPVCGRRMLKVEMEIHQVHQGWLFNIGDSQSNDGWGEFSFMHNLYKAGPIRFKQLTKMYKWNKD